MADLIVFNETDETLRALELKPGKTAWEELQFYNDILHGEKCTFSAVATKDTIYALTWRKRFFSIAPYDESPTWKTLDDFRDGHGPCPPAVTVGGSVYTCGGGWEECESCRVDDWTTERFSAKCEKFDPATKTWNHIPDLKTPRRLNSMVNASGILYCIGGLGARFPDDDAGRELDLVEKYDSSRNEWVTVTPMKMPRVAPAVAAYKNCIYVLGGGFQNGRTRSTEYYDEELNTWTMLKQDMCCERIKFYAFVRRKRLYAIGGDRESCTAEKLDLSDNAKEWQEIESFFSDMEINGMASVIMKRPQLAPTPPSS